MSVTVAAIAERDGRFLVVEEQTDEGVRINQPAGHLEPDESLADGAARETLEETAYRFEPRVLVGVYRWRNVRKGTTYVRFCFAGEASGPEPDRALDHGILRAIWVTPAELRARSESLRSPLVLRCVEDYLSGRRYPIDVVTDQV